MNKVLLTKKEFKTAMEVLPVASKEDLRPILQCVYFNNNDVVAIDGYRLAVRKINSSLNAEFCILASELKEVLKAVKKDTQSISISTDFKKAYISLINKENDIVKEFTLSLFEGRFPNYKTLTPTGATTRINYIDTDEIIEEIKRLKQDTVCLNIEKNSIDFLDVEFNKQVTHIGKNLNKKINCVSTGDNLEIAFSKKFIKEAIKNYKNDFTMRFTRGIDPLVIESNDKTKLDLILPVRLIMGNSVAVIRDYKGEKLTSMSDTELKNLPF